jgi:hypothetical protein
LCFNLLVEVRTALGLQFHLRPVPIHTLETCEAFELKPPSAPLCFHRNDNRTTLHLIWLQRLHHLRHRMAQIYANAAAQCTSRTRAAHMTSTYQPQVLSQPIPGLGLVLTAFFVTLHALSNVIRFRIRWHVRRHGCQPQITLLDCQSTLLDCTARDATNRDTHCSTLDSFQEPRTRSWTPDVISLSTCLSVGRTVVRHAGHSTWSHTSPMITRNRIKNVLRACESRNVDLGRCQE